jgi:hypothetical protein
MVIPIPASAEQNEHDGSGVGKRAPTLLATPPFLVEVNQSPSCAIVNVGAVPRQVTFTFHTEETQSDGTPIPDVVTLLTIPATNRVLRFQFAFSRSVNPVLVYCKFESTDTSTLRADGSVGVGIDFGGILRTIEAKSRG